MKNDDDDDDDDDRMDRDKIATGLFVGYHVLIMAIFAAVLPTLRNAARKPQGSGYLAMAAISFASTWYYMLRYYEASYINYTSQFLHSKDIAPWLRNSQLFREAWQMVFANELRGLWGQALCSFVAGPFTILLVDEGRTRRVPLIWAYLLLALFVSVSFALCLFLAACSVYPRQIKSTANPRLLYLCVAGNLTAIYFLPKASNFMAALLLIHAVPLVPVLLQVTPPSGTTRVYIHSAITGAFLHLRNLYKLQRSGHLSMILPEVWTHPAVSSVVADVTMVAVTVVFHTGYKGLLSLPGGIGSAGFSLAQYLARRGHQSLSDPAPKSKRH